MEIKSSKVCPWCDDVEGCRNRDESDCDFKTLPMEPNAIKVRMDDENAKILKLMTVKYEDLPSLLKAKAESSDRLQGIRIMKQVYEGKFGMFYHPTNQLEMTKAFLDFMKQGKLLERAAKK